MTKKRPYRFIAGKLLNKAADIITERGKTHGGEEQQERNMTKCVTAFNALTGHNLPVWQGWLFMQILKMSRMTSGDLNIDDYDDNTGYAALMAEQVYNDSNTLTDEEKIDKYSIVVTKTPVKHDYSDGYPSPELGPLW